MEPVERFALAVAQPEGQIDLAEAALWIAAAGDPDIEVPYWMTALDELADGIEPTIEDLRRRLFDELGFHGDSGDYYDPENSFLHRVIERRLGIPITLAVLTIEIGRRAGVRLEGIGMPGHFLVRDVEDGTLYDPFHGGDPIDLAGAEQLFRQATGAGRAVPFGAHLLIPSGPIEILTRMLSNLRGIYEMHEDPWNLEWVIRMLLALPGSGPREVVALGETMAKQGRFLDAAEEMEAFAAADEENAEALELAARAMRARLN